MMPNSKQRISSPKLLIVLALAAGLAVSTPQSAKAEPMREFLMSCTYGVLAGSLVGAATLAFRDNPGEHLKSIAVGASLGLYAGILLGAYVVYMVPGDYEEDYARAVPLASPKGILVPSFDRSGQVEGAQLQYMVATF